MLTMDETNYITALQKFEGLSMREISRRTGFHFNTVKKYIDCDDWNLVIIRPDSSGAKCRHLNRFSNY
jgi:hypothetical protein